MYHLNQPLKVNAVDGSFMGHNTHRMQSLKLSFPDSHCKRISFHVFDSMSIEIILGLELHSPHVEWSTVQVISWGNTANTVTSSSVTEDPDLLSVPSCQHDLKEVFNEAKAKALPPHRPYDCVIDLFPGSSPPNTLSLYSQSPPECKPMEEYVRG